MAQRGRERDRGKERYWRQMLRQWRGSGGTIRDFCSVRGLSEPSFYAWRQTIAARDRQKTPRQRPDGRRSMVRPGNGEPHGRGIPAFIPVRVAPTAPAPLEVVLRDGHVVRIPAGFDAATLRQLLAVLDEATPC
jgi:hypothetical protein